MLLRLLVRPGPDNEYLAKLRVLSFEHAIEAPGTVASGSSGVASTPDTAKFTMRWQFSLTDAHGRVVVGLAKTTQSPMPAIGNVGSLSASIRSLNNAVVDEIAQAIDRALQEEKLTSAE
jgi:hypothetical protein